MAPPYPPGVPFFMVQGKRVFLIDDDPETRLKAQMMNAAGFFRKPVDGTALFDAIEWATRSDK